MSEYIDPEFLQVDSDELVQDAYDRMQDAFPGWEPSEAQPETMAFEATATWAADNRYLLSAQMKKSMIYFGTSIIGLAINDAVEATVTSTWTAKQVAPVGGYTIAQGDRVTIADASGEPIAFEVVDDVVIAEGDIATVAGEVELRAVLAGTFANGLSGTAEDLESRAWVDSIAVVGQSSGGADQETEDQYLSRLIRRQSIMSPKILKEKDASLLALDIAGVARALTIDGHNPADPTNFNEGHFTTAVMASDGTALGSLVKDEVLAYLTEHAVQGSVPHVVDPDETAIDVTYTVVLSEGAVEADVVAAVDAALTEYLSPINWGRPDHGEADEWELRDTVYYNEVVTLISNTEGVDRVASLTLAGGTASGDDRILADYFPVTTVGTITGSEA